MSNPLGTPGPWDMVSAAYAEEVAPMLAAYARDALSIVAPPPGARVLDVACGPGTLARLAAEAGHPVDALDFAPEMIARLGHVPGVTAIVGDGQALPYADRTFGAAFSMFGLMFFPDRAAGFRELARVLVPGARAAITSWQPLADNRVMAAMFGALRAHLPPSPPPDLPLITADACRAEMGAAFGDVEVRELVHEQRYADADALWDSLARTMAPIVLMRARAGEAKWAAMAADACAAVNAATGAGPQVMKMPAWLTIGTSR